MTEGAEGCIFCGIVAGTVPADVVHRTDRSVAFRDLNPVAPTHVLVVPAQHHEDAVALAVADPEGAADLVATAAAVAEAEGLTGYRLVYNTGREAGQTVFHTHLHVLGGRSLTWPPG